MRNILSVPSVEKTKQINQIYLHVCKNINQSTPKGQILTVLSAWKWDLPLHNLLPLLQRKFLRKNLLRLGYFSPDGSAGNRSQTFSNGKCTEHKVNTPSKKKIGWFVVCSVVVFIQSRKAYQKFSRGNLKVIGAFKAHLRLFSFSRSAYQLPYVVEWYLERKT